MNQENELIQQLKKQINNLELQLNNEKNKNKDLINQINNLLLQLQNNDNKYKKILYEKENEIKKLMKEYYKAYSSPIKHNNINFIRSGEKIITIKFYSKKPEIFNYPLPCKNTDLFVHIEERLNKDFPQLGDKHYYLVNGNIKIKRFKTIDENEIKNNDVITIKDLSFKKI